MIGTAGFVEGLFRAQRWRHGPKRKTGARKLRGGAEWGELRVRPVG